MALPQGRKKTAERPELTVITKAKKLMEYTFTITNSENRFPKKIRSWMGHAKHGDTYHLRKLIEEEFSGTIWNKKGSA